MPQLDSAFICRVLQQPLNPTNTIINRVIIDSRQAQVGDLFVALKGERFDAHDFVDEVLAKGAVCLTDRADCVGKAGCLNVANTEQALGQLANAWRCAVNPELIVFGITGSSGKTTVKEMLAAVLRQHAGNDAVLATAGNFNNHIGLPLTLLQLQAQHRYAVIEMGMNHFGELAYLSSLAKPDFALVNNALRAHIGCGFDNVADIAKAKSEIYSELPENGIGFIPCGDEHAEYFQAVLTKHRYYRFGIDCGEIRAENIRLAADSVSFDLLSQSAKTTVHIPCPGKHTIHNALAAAALALAANVPHQTIADALAHFANIKGRLQFKRSVKGALLIDDTYNANPDSMKAAIDVLAKQTAPRVLIMGAMAELGENAPAMHAEVGVYAKQCGIEHALFFGEHADTAAQSYGSPHTFFTDKADLIAAAKALNSENKSFLIKGSRSMKMEEVVAALV
ncbi:UDP-N-acetylmuramoyl-tripeptide--D-alanyl-D-alanine ligase [Stenoxybacter acetivorans]|uniref:UDP-N-acetylmuramoyl-tripeptide--D-alanyl-D- alanine ligase n=1 Tax=Stenoxybacter acetivorans TaxID=422441 RepID=UPI0005672819|nr:UDP-N-acetylmuramoyl-tripeptide--D-alanyl-D-alanine ligase [Stenoxybacter acetivorans]